MVLIDGNELIAESQPYDGYIQSSFSHAANASFLALSMRRNTPPLSGHHAPRALI
jgi:hypothetical protein